MANDLTKAPKQIILDLVNAKTGKGFTEAMFDWVGKTVVEATGKNTSLTLTAVEGSGYTGEQTIHYNRPHLGTDVGAAFVASGNAQNPRDLVFTIGDGTKKSSLIPEINSRLGINLTTDDYEDGDLPTFSGELNEEHDVQIVVKADSLIFTGSITIQLKAEDIDLATAIPDVEMDGLVYAPPAVV